MSSFKIPEFFVHNNPEAEAQRTSVQTALNNKTERESEHANSSFGSQPQGYSERKHQHLEKTTSSVLSVFLLIYAPKHEV